MQKEPIPTPAEIWKILREVSLGQKEMDRMLRKSQEESDLRKKEADLRKKEADQRTKETNQQMRETDKKIAKLERTINKIGSNFNDRWGHFVESLVKGKLSRLLNARGIQVLHTYPNVERARYNDQGEVLERKEFDIILVNGDEVVVVEVKTTLNKKHVESFLSDTVKNFKKYFTDHKKRKLYGAVAYLKCMDGADSFAEGKGLFVIRATGDSAHIINNKNFKPKVFP